MPAIQRAEAGQADRHHGLHVRDPLSAARHRTCRDIGDAAGRLRGLLEGLEKRFDPNEAVSASYPRYPSRTRSPGSAERVSALLRRNVRSAPNAPRYHRGCNTDARAWSDGGRFATDNPGRHSFAGRIGRGTKPPPQFGHTLASLCLDTIGAEGAFIAADARFRRIRRQVLVAIFAVRPKLQRHGGLAMLQRG